MLDFLMFGSCAWDTSDILLIAVYAGLFAWCGCLICDHRNTWLSGQAIGLIWYLSFTLLLCFFRLVVFYIILTSRELCDTRYKAWQWDISGSATTTILSTACVGLFFTSYSYFANSLAKVLEMLINDYDGISYVSEKQFLVAQTFLNIIVWSTLFYLWYCCEYYPSNRGFASLLAEVSVSFSSIITCIFFSQHVARAWWFLKRSPFEAGGKASQLYRLMGLKRVLGVARVVTLCFLVRALVMLTRVNLTAWMEDGYFFLTEILPTAYLLNAFKSSEGSPEEYDDVAAMRDTITSVATGMQFLSSQLAGSTLHYYGSHNYNNNNGNISNSDTNNNSNINSSNKVFVSNSSAANKGKVVVNDHLKHSNYLPVGRIGNNSTSNNNSSSNGGSTYGYAGNHVSSVYAPRFHTSSYTKQQQKQQPAQYLSRAGTTVSKPMDPSDTVVKSGGKPPTHPRNMQQKQQQQQTPQQSQQQFRLRDDSSNVFGLMSSDSDDEYFNNNSQFVLQSSTIHEENRQLLSPNLESFEVDLG